MIIALSGPSGIGKGFMKESVLAGYPDAKELVWYTTRAPRPNETNRKSISEEQFASLADAGKLALVQGIFGHRYGVAVDDLLEKSGIWLTEIHPFVVADAKQINSELRLIGLVTDDLDLLRERLTLRRKTEKPDEIGLRLKTAIDEMESIKKNAPMFERIVTISRDNESSIPIIAQEIVLNHLKEGE